MRFWLPVPLLFQLDEQRASHSDELRRALLEADARATELRVSVVAEKNKQFGAEKDALETRLRAGAAADLELAAKRFDAKLGDGLEAQVGSPRRTHQTRHTPHERSRERATE